ncbi:hypothetical protein SAMN05216588_10622 [Pseudomonas flavescens]|uniref:Lipoprotein n=1 Tax=Phytopseudomonas flavescens TaxID=29435 RepID=A0A1G8DZY6_9GAMM|nr:hypothetical protein SAMN05216588_10622 [Pseudomonas flavescens]
MRNVAVVLTLCTALGGCSWGGVSRDACDVFSPAEIDLPTTRDEPRIEEQSTGDATPSRGEQDC